MARTTEAAARTTEAASAELKLTPAEWLVKLGLVRRADTRRFPQRVDTVDWRHQAADTLHGWSEHAHHYQGEGQQLRLTESDYRAALGAAAKYPTVAPHAPALSPLKAPKFASFKPRKSTRDAKNAGPKIGSGKIGDGRLGA